MQQKDLTSAHGTTTSLAFWIFLIPVLLWLFCLIVLPQMDLLYMSFRSDDFSSPGWTLDNYKIFFEEPIYWLTFVRTTAYACLATFCTLILSLPIAFYIAKVIKKKLSTTLMLLLLLPFWVNELVRVYGWMILLRESGIINFALLQLGIVDAPIEMLYNDAAMLMGLVYSAMLFMVVPLISTMDSLDDSLIEAGYDLGASRLCIWRTIILPHCKSGIISGSIMVFMLSLGNYLTVNLLGGKNSLWFTEQIYNQFIASFNWNQGAAFGFLLLSISSILVWLGLKASRQTLGGVAS